MRQQIHKGADILAANPAGETPVFIALRAGHVETALYLLQLYHSVSPTTAVVDAARINRDGWTFLHAASYFGYDSVVAQCLDAKNSLSIDCRTARGETPLHLACSSSSNYDKGSSSPQIVSRLMAHGADISACTTTMKQTPLHLASQGGHALVVHSLIRELATLGRLDQMNSRNKDGETPLFVAVRHGHVSAAANLLQAGADPARRDANEKTPLHAAAEGGSMACLELLLRQQPSVTINALDIHDRTPLYWSARNGHLNLCKALCQAGADATLGKSPTVGASTFGHDEILQYLHQHQGATLGKLHANERSPVHMAAQQGQLSTVQYLVQQGEVSIHVRDEWGFTVSIYYFYFFACGCMAIIPKKCVVS